MGILFNAKTSSLNYRARNLQPFQPRSYVALAKLLDLFALACGPVAVKVLHQHSGSWIPGAAGRERGMRM